MKKFILLFAIALLMGCVPSPDMPDSDGIRLSQEYITVGAMGGTHSVDVTSNYAYRATSDVEWITIKKENSSSLQFVVSINDSQDTREGTITLFCDDYNHTATLTVFQSTDGQVPSNEIWYTSTDGAVVTPYSGDHNHNATAIEIFGVDVVSNTYENGKGVIKLAAPITAIGWFAFYGCSSLTSIAIPNSVTLIGQHTFYGCCNLTSVTIPNSLTGISIYAFWGCSSLTSITIPDSVTEIETEAFQGCTSLTNVIIGNSVTSIGSAIFSGCNNLRAFYGKFASEDNRCLIIDNVLKSFAPAGLSEYTIPDSVTEIGYSAFSYCTSLTSITIPNSVISIGGYAFHNCTSLTEVYCKATTPPAGGFGMFFLYYDESYNYCWVNGKIYVPTASVEAYKVAKYWSDYAPVIEGKEF